MRSGFGVGDWKLSKIKCVDKSKYADLRGVPLLRNVLSDMLGTQNVTTKFVAVPCNTMHSSCGPLM